MRPKWWRQWYRWIAFPSAVFLLFASVTGILTAWYEFFGEEEALVGGPGRCSGWTRTPTSP